MKNYPKNAGQDKLCRVYELKELWFASPRIRGPALLSAFIWKISSPPRRDLGYSIARSRQGGLTLLSYKRKQILTILSLSETRGISAKRAGPTRLQRGLALLHINTPLASEEIVNSGFYALNNHLLIQAVSIIRTALNRAWTPKKINEPQNININYTTESFSRK